MTSKLDALAAPRATDTRFERLARLAVGRIANEGGRISRSNLATKSVEVDADPPGRKRGFCEATIDNNSEVRAVFEAAKMLQARAAPRSRGAISAQVRRLTAWEAARKLMLARDATTERLAAVADLMSRTGLEMPEPLTDLSTRRDALPANRAVGSMVSGCAAKQRAAAETNRVNYTAAKTAAGDAGVVQTRAAIAAAANVHPSTVARLKRIADEIAEAEGGGRPAVIPPHSLLRLGRREIHRALDMERRYIRAIDHAVGTMAREVVEREIEAMRAARLDAERKECGD